MRSGEDVKSKIWSREHMKKMVLGDLLDNICPLLYNNSKKEIENDREELEILNSILFWAQSENLVMVCSFSIENFIENSPEII